MTDAPKTDAVKTEQVKTAAEETTTVEYPELKYCPNCGLILNTAPAVDKMECTKCHIYWKVLPGLPPGTFAIVRANPSGEAYSHQGCIFAYCPTPEICEPHRGCRHVPETIPGAL